MHQFYTAIKQMTDQKTRLYAVTQMVS